MLSTMVYISKLIDENLLNETVPSEAVSKTKPNAINSTLSSE